LEPERLTLENIEGVKAWCTLIVPSKGNPHATVVEVVQMGNVPVTFPDERHGHNRIDVIGYLAAFHAERALFEHRGITWPAELDLLTLQLACDRYSALDIRIAGSTEPRLCIRPSDPTDAIYVLAAGIGLEWVLLGELRWKDAQRHERLQ
jgi:hypothetical protein